MNEKKKKHKVARTIGIIVLVLFLLIASVSAYAVIKLNGTVENLTRVDEDGALYYGEVTQNYYDTLSSLPFRFVKGSGCSAFMTHNENGDVITCRNYDLPHMDDEGNITGLNVVLKLEPEGKYASINTADAAWLSYIGLDYYKGALDDGKTTKIPMGFLPYLCMDGMNEKGLSASILALDVKDGEKAVDQDVEGKESVTVPELLRYTLDSCANVEEAAEMAKNYNVSNILDGDYHMFLSDADGVSAVFEWRYNTLTVTYTDAVTNFYVGYDDAEDCYYGDDLKEAFTGPVWTNRTYHYGYGHGYERFKTVVSGLNSHITNWQTYDTAMTESEATQLIGSVAQDYTGELTSYTQYTAVYNNSQKTVTLYSQQDYEHPYTFSVN